jgi:hypothetical protein
MEVKAQNIQDRVRENTSKNRNAKIDQRIIKHVAEHSYLSKDQITMRIEKLRNEWDIERALEVNASSLALTGLILGLFGSKKWFVLSGVFTAFLLQHGIQGWCPPLPVLRAMGIRTRQEIDEEIYAMKVLRGDFEAKSPMMAATFYAKTSNGQTREIVYEEKTPDIILEPGEEISISANFWETSDDDMFDMLKKVLIKIGGEDGTNKETFMIE